MEMDFVDLKFKIGWDLIINASPGQGKP